MDARFFLKVVALGAAELKGESTALGFIGWIEVVGYNVGSTQTGSGTGIGPAAAKKRKGIEFFVTKYLDQTTAGFFSLVTSGNILDSFTLVGAKVESGGRLTPFVKLEDKRPATLKDGEQPSFVSGMMSADGSSDTPKESLSFYLANPVWTYFYGGKATAQPSSAIAKAVADGAATGAGVAAGGMMGSGAAGKWSVKKHPPFGSGSHGGIGGFKRPPHGK